MKYTDVRSKISQRLKLAEIDFSNNDTFEEVLEKLRFQGRNRYILPKKTVADEVEYVKKLSADACASLRGFRMEGAAKIKEELFKLNWETRTEP